MGRVSVDIYYKGREKPVVLATERSTALEAQKVLYDRRGETPPVCIVLEDQLIVVDEVQHMKVW